MEPSALLVKTELDLNKAFSRNQDLLDHYDAKTNDGVVELKMSSQWESMFNNSLVFRRVELPEDWAIYGDVVVTLVGEKFEGPSAEFEQDRLIFILAGEVVDPVSGSFYKPEDSPIKVPAGQMFNTHGVEDSLLVVYLTENHKAS